MTFGFWSVVPPLLAIVLAIRTRQVIFSLLAGLLAGYTILNQGNPFMGLLHSLDGLVNVFKSASNTRTVLFTLFIGVLIQLMRYAGGVDGFIQLIARKFENARNPSARLQAGAGLTGFLLFIESNISILTVGTVFRPLFDRYKISREKLAYLADSSSAPSCILFPVNAWGAYIMGLLATYESIDPFKTLVLAIPFNFYAILTLGMVFWLAISGRDFGPMKQAKPVALVEKGEVTKAGKSIDMLLPLLTMVMTMPCFLVYTGWDSALEGTFSGKIWNSISNGSGSAAVLYAVVTAILVAVVKYFIQKKLSMKSLMEESIKGMNEMLTMALLMALAFAIGNLCDELGTGNYVADVTSGWLSPSLAPALIFVTSCFIAFSTGTSWGTFAIMMAIAMPLALKLDANIYLMVAAVLGGGVFGDHCSPISDTTLIASVASGCDHIDHVRTQLPYALITGALSVLLYIVAGFLF
jgi:tetracycline resistance efflux pump